MKTCFLLILLSAMMIYAQSSVHYPLGKGNQWDFHITYDGGPGPDFSIIVVGDTLLPNGLRYAIKMRETFKGAVSLNSFERFSNDSVYSYIKDKDTLIWYFFKKDTLITLSHNHTLNYTIDTVDFNGRHFKRWGLISKSASAGFGTDIGIFYADSGGYFGEYNYNTEFYLSTDITAAIIDGIVYGNPHKTILGVQNDSKETVREYRLLQNYPNPFNPATTIKYSIPENQNVKLTVYDMLGKEVSVLVNEYKRAGSYKVQFDGSSLPSGIYVYTIQAGQYRDSKKFVLLK